MMIISLMLMFGGTFFYLIAVNISITSYRRLVDHQFQHFHDLWERDGRPTGGKIARSQLSFLGSDFSSMFCGIQWALERPDWLAIESGLEQLRIRMIRWFFISLIGLFAVMGGMVLFAITLAKTG